MTRTQEKRLEALYSTVPTHLYFESCCECVDDNPAVSYGIPISLDWNVGEMAPLELHVYESARVGARKNLRQMTMNSLRMYTTTIATCSFAV